MPVYLDLQIMGILSRLAPWIVYWVLVGNVPFVTASVLALVVAIASSLVGRTQRKSLQTIDIGAIATFAVLTVFAFDAERVGPRAVAPDGEQRGPASRRRHQRSGR